MRIVDVHAHCYPPSYLKELRRIGIGEEGGIGVFMPEWSSTEERIAEMDALGVAMHILSLSSPNVYFPDAGLSRSLARMSNDFISDVCKKYPERFLGLASVPLNNLDFAFEELDRALNGLGMDGVVLGTNINQRSLAEDQFLPFLEELDRRRIPVVLHPMKAIGEDLMPPEDRELTIPSNVNFLFETTRTIAEMTFKGTFEKYRNLTFVLPHSGGAIPFLWPRWDIAYLARSTSHPLRRIPNIPSFYLKRHYYDTALAYYPSILRCTIELASDHLVFGTDTPYTSRDFRAGQTIERIESYGFSEAEKELIFFKNAEVLFPKIKERSTGSNVSGRRSTHV